MHLRLLAGRSAGTILGFDFPRFPRALPAACPETESLRQTRAHPGLGLVGDTTVRGPDRPIVGQWVWLPHKPDVAMDCSQIDLFDCADSTGGTALRRLRRLALPPGWYIFQPPLTRRRTAASMRAIWMTKCPASARPAMLAGGARLGAAITSQSFVDRGSPRRSGRLSQPRWMSGARPDRGRIEAREFGQYAGKRGPEPGYPHRRCKCTPPDPRTSTPS